MTADATTRIAQVRYTMIECRDCHQERRIQISTPSALTVACKRRCRPCAGAARGADIDEVAVQRLLSGEPPVYTTRAERQAAVKQLVANRMANRVIAERLHVSQRTIERLRARVAS